jgi:hypothetical protein
VRTKATDGELLLFSGIKDTCTLQVKETGAAGLDLISPNSMKTWILSMLTMLTPVTIMSSTIFILVLQLAGIIEFSVLLMVTTDTQVTDSTRPIQDRTGT